MYIYVYMYKHKSLCKAFKKFGTIILYVDCPSAIKGLSLFITESQLSTTMPDM